MWWAPVERWAEGQPLTHLSFPPLLAPLQLGCLQSPHESPEPGAGQTGGCAVMGGGGAEPPAHLDCRPSTVRGRCPQPLGFYSCTAEYLMPGAAPPGAAPSFIFLTKKKDKRRAGGRWRCAAVCLLCGWGSAWHGGRGSYGAPAAPFRGRAHVLPPRSHRGIRVAWHSLKGWAEGLGRRAEPCWAAGQLALVSVPAAGVLPQVSPATLDTASISAASLAPRGGGMLCPALPAACSEPFSSQMLYMK